MTFYNLELKIEGFISARDRQDEIYREMTYQLYLAPHIDPKAKRTLTREKLWPLKKDAGKKKNEIEGKLSRVASAIKSMNDGKTGT